MTAPLLEVTDLTRRFEGLTAVDGASFTVGVGERVGLIGPNGAGKTTCFNMLGGQLRADGGAVCLDGRPVLGFKPGRLWRAGIGRTFQITATFPSMTVRENVQVALMSHHRRIFRPFSRGDRQYRGEADALLTRVEMGDQAERLCAVLAYGDLKRLELAVALANRPRLLLMDEPTAGMAPAERGALMRLVDSVVAEEGLAVLFTEHDMDVVFGHADRVLVMARGQLIARGTPDEVRLDPTVREVYLGGSISPTTTADQPDS